MFQSIVTQPVFSQSITEQRGEVGRGAEMLVEEIYSPTGSKEAEVQDG